MGRCWGEYSNAQVSFYPFWVDVFCSRTPSSPLLLVETIFVSFWGMPLSCSMWFLVFETQLFAPFHTGMDSDSRVQGYEEEGDKRVKNIDKRMVLMMDHGI